MGEGMKWNGEWIDLDDCVGPSVYTIWSLFSLDLMEDEDAALEGGTFLSLLLPVQRRSCCFLRWHLVFWLRLILM